ncbi:MAG: alpha/beta hydrolase [Pseudomonadota bacterium]|nr:alpha/beta hydrolase [Pseudomonadota bacterium]
MPTIQVNGIDIHYEEAGTGEALVLVHNVIANLHSYDYNFPQFARHFRTIRFDLRGHGRSSKVASQDEAPGFYTYENTAEDLYQLLRALGVETCYLVGQAYWGVSTTAVFCARHPEMVKAWIPVSCEIMVTPDGQGLFDQLSGELKAGFLRLFEVARSEGMEAVFEERKQTKTFWGPKVFGSPHIMDLFRRMYASTAATTFLNFPLIRPALKQEILDSLNGNRIPTLMLMGSQDPDPDRNIAAMKQDYPNAHAVILPDCGHYVAIENPEDFNRAVLHFIAGVRAGY